MEAVFKKVEAGIDAAFGGEKHSNTHIDETCDHLHPQGQTVNRYHSFAAPSSGNVKWYVDGCSYFWAVSEALERKMSPSPEVVLRECRSNVSAWQRLERRSL
jgi:phospholipase D1/2